jgi:hypothetical protein
MCVTVKLPSYPSCSFLINLSTISNLSFKLTGILSNLVSISVKSTGSGIVVLSNIYSTLSNLVSISLKSTGVGIIGGVVFSKVVTFSSTISNLFSTFVKSTGLGIVGGSASSSAFNLFSTSVKSTGLGIEGGSAFSKVVTFSSTISNLFSIGDKSTGLGIVGGSTSSSAFNLFSEFLILFLLRLLLIMNLIVPNLFQWLLFSSVYVKEEDVYSFFHDITFVRFSTFLIFQLFYSFLPHLKMNYVCFLFFFHIYHDDI